MLVEVKEMNQRVKLLMQVMIVLAQKDHLAIVGKMAASLQCFKGTDAN
jgi:hypothetical protein